MSKSKDELKPGGMKKCKHDLGWCILAEHTNIFIWKDGRLAFNFENVEKKSYKVRCRCNYPECHAQRNIYISGKVVKYGKIQ